MGGRGANSNKKQYIRFGDVPKSGKSINWLTMTNDDADVIQWDLENGGELLEKMLKPEHYEKGISAFELDSNGFPKLENLQIITTLAALLENGEKAYTLKGKIIGKGNDGEPVLDSIKNKKEINISKDEYVNHIINVLKKKFKNVTGKLNIKEKGDITDHYNEQAGEQEYLYKGLTFRTPKKNFNTYLGYAGTNRKFVPLKKQYWVDKEIPLKDYVKSKKLKTSKYTSKKGKNMISYVENGRTITYTEEQFNNKKITDYVEEWR